MIAGTNCFGYRIPSLHEILARPSTAALIRAALADAFDCLGIPANEGRALTESVIIGLGNNDDIQTVERHLASLCAKQVSATALRHALDSRAELIATQISPHLRGSRILDLGCGDGMVMELVGQAGREVVLADVMCYVDERATFPFTLLKREGLGDLSPPFDTVLALTVLHHADDPRGIVADLRALSAKRVIVIESVVDPPTCTCKLAELLANQDFDTRFAFAVFADWFYNRVLHENVAVPFNFGKVGDWHRLFENFQFSPVLSENLGIDQRLVPEVHFLMVYDNML